MANNSNHPKNDNDYGIFNKVAYGDDQSEQPKEMWKPQRNSNATTALLFAALGFFILWAIDYMAHVDAVAQLGFAVLVDALKSVHEIVAFLLSPASLIIAIVLLVGGIALEMWEQTRTPPPMYRVRDELITALIDSGILKPDVERMNSQIRIFPSSHYDKLNHCYSLEFELKSVKATPDRMEKLQEGLASAFYKAQEVELEPSRDKRGNQVGWLLHVFYDVDPFSKTLEQNNPFDDDPLAPADKATRIKKIMKAGR